MWDEQRDPGSALVDRRAWLAAAGAGLLTVLGAKAAEPARRPLLAEPDSYWRRVERLRAGDTLLLAPGEYPRGLWLHGLEGTPAAPIAIQALDPLRPPVFPARAGANTVSLLDSRWLVLRHLRLEGGGQRVDAVKAEGHARFADFIELDGLQITGYGPWQDVVGISTKCPAQGWVVRNNTVVGAGTGMYFGQSDGSAPFVGALLEGNRVLGPVGYGIQIKHQRARGGPDAPQATVIRRNLVLKAANSSTGALARPNLLLGHQPLAGTGASDGYQVYGNVFFNNPGEALLQAEGNLAIYNNLFSNPAGDAVRVMAHKHRPRQVAVFGNTVVARSIGIEISGGEAGYERSARANLVYAQSVDLGPIAVDNVFQPWARARDELVEPWAPPPALDLRPRSRWPAGGGPLPPDLLQLPGAGDDFHGRGRSTFFAGACPPVDAGPERCG